MSPEKAAARLLLLAAAARYLGLDPGDGEIKVIMLHDTGKAAVNGPPPASDPDDGPVTLVRLPGLWQRLLGILAGADAELPAVEIERRLRPDFQGDRATPEVSLRLKDMAEAGKIVSGRHGYRLATTLRP
jgi:hypothetical protein